MIENKGDMKCRHPHSKCRFMIGLSKRYRKPPSERKCGVAHPDSVCLPRKGKQDEKVVVIKRGKIKVVHNNELLLVTKIRGEETTDLFTFEEVEEFIKQKRMHGAP